MLLSVDGTANITIGRECIALRPRQLLVLDAAAETETKNERLWARCEWRLRSPILRQERFSEYYNRPLTVNAENYSLITSMTNVISTNRRFGESAGETTLHDALASALASTLCTAADEPTTLSPPQAKIIRAARRVIDDCYDDPLFNVRELAKAVSVSPDYLRHLAALTGTSPREMIEKRRVSAANALLRANPVRSRETLEVVRRSSGYTTVRRMQDAIARQKRRGYEGG